MVDLFNRFIDEMKNGRFFDAHEIMEDYWHTIRKTQNPEKNVVRSFVNAAVACELSLRGKKTHALKVWQNYKKRRHLMDENPLFKETALFLDTYEENLFK